MNKINVNKIVYKRPDQKIFISCINLVNLLQLVL